MSRIGELFAGKKNNILNVYFTAGYPTLNSTLTIMKSLEEAGADMIELGMPYSDPLADGPVIQASSTIALANGMTIGNLLLQLKNFRKEVKLPVLLMGYMNPVIQYGFERFCQEAAEVGVDGIILPDLPMFEFEKTYAESFRKYGLDFIFLVTPETPEGRVRQLDQVSTGFLYAVSSSSTTGNESVFPGQEKYFKKLQSMKLKNPVLIGFGIKDKPGFLNACSYANGGIIGTAFIKALENSPETKLPDCIKMFIGTIR